MRTDVQPLEQLAEDYEVIGELASRAGARVFMSKRRTDDRDVLITVTGIPAGDEGNALSHLAADSNLLSGRSHRALLPVLEARWVGDESFAIVTERTTAPTLEELLARRDEEFDYPRVAMVLQEINGLLDWARGQRVVHRALSADSIFVEPGSDRVQATFEARALPLADMPGAEDDARTVAALARAMLTRSAAAPERAGQPLAELRPGLPAAVVAQTEALLAPRKYGQEAPDVRGYIAAIAMADTLKRGETEAADSLAKLREEERVARAEIEARQEACERAASDQAERFREERETRAEQFREEREAQAKQFGKERAAILREKEAVQAQLAREHRELVKVREALERERAELDRKFSDLEQERGKYAATQDFQTPLGVEVQKAGREPRWERAAFGIARRWKLVSRRRLAFAAGALALVIVVVLAAVSRRPAAGFATRVNAAGTVDSAAGVIAGRPVDSASNVVAADSSESFLTGIPLDLVTGVSQRAAEAPVAPAPGRRPVRRDTSPGLPPTTRDTMPRPDTVSTLPVSPGFLPIAGPRSDSLRPPTDSAARRDSIRRDSLLRRDTLARRDTLVRRDTMP